MESLEEDKVRVEDIVVSELQPPTPDTDMQDDEESADNMETDAAPADPETVNEVDFEDVEFDFDPSLKSM
jgi:hypothetical protein